MSHTSRFRRSALQRHAAGFSLLELMIAMAIALILSTMAIPTLNAVRGARLHEAGSDYAALLQQARIQAIQNDTYYATVVVAGPPAQAFVDLNGNGTYDNGEPTVVFPASVFPRTYSDSPPNLNNLESIALAQANDPSVEKTKNPTFGPRGLPCDPATASGYTTCPSFAGPNGALGTSYITFFQSEPDQKWEAVVLNPAARVRVYNYDGKGLKWILAE